ncbi:MAG: hypothetical protein ACO1RA_04695 [Planctomycetaceae bacterium]
MAMALKMWTEEEGLLSFEWTLLVTLMTIGAVSGMTAARDAIIDELGDTAEVMLAIDQSYTINYPLNNDVHSIDGTSSADSGFIDAEVFTDCDRTVPINDQAVLPIDDKVGPEF